ncbi:transcriptional regulator [Spongiactinospora sp. TRM90649]|uniref:transcriptional regulator n=1 Tax=Spongiactinospora sp. TRM90649 TaxID=3031114 RepID=UPI0023F71E97|nr:transcriptional regulator [Spongiactinospora sp. TRM90649]MDF5754393.1 transcriptional regulator [Spongiactinospora sp. TRM90649]
MTLDSPTGLLVLHAVRLNGYADTPAIAERFGFGETETKEELLDAEARGWVERTVFGGTGGWSLTDAGRAADERLLAAELTRAGGGDEVRAIYREFMPLNALLLRACTDWQLRPTADDRLATNDHTDPAWDAAALATLDAVEQGLGPLVERLTGVLSRFGGYDTRFGAALARARAGDGAWVDRMHVDSCHRVWFQLHEDLIATLGIDRHREP